MYPNKLRDAHTDEAKNMRWQLGFQVYLHMLFFLVSLTAIGFASMLLELVFGAWGYSCYLTLNSCQILVYLLAMLCSTAYGAFNIFDNRNNVAMLFYISNLVFYIFAVYFGFMKFTQFRRAGALRSPETDPKHEKLLKKDKKDKKDTKGKKKDLEKGKK